MSLRIIVMQYILTLLNLVSVVLERSTLRTISPLVGYPHQYILVGPWQTDDTPQSNEEYAFWSMN
ncbi:hypothetical protein M758_5G164400 [Ceratodon purpureus]|nr:hypothetical protein M758_5G164400 [Ceratodon purpureus]